MRDTVKRIVEAKGVYLRRLKAQVLPSLPPKQFQRVRVPLPSDQAELYAIELQGLVHDVKAVTELQGNSSITSASFLTRTMRLFQICSNPSQLYKEYAGTPGKLIALDGGFLREFIGKRPFPPPVLPAKLARSSPEV